MIVKRAGSMSAKILAIGTKGFSSRALLIIRALWRSKNSLTPLCDSPVRFSRTFYPYGKSAGAYQLVGTDHKLFLAAASSPNFVEILDHSQIYGWGKPDKNDTFTDACITSNSRLFVGSTNGVLSFKLAKSANNPSDYLSVRKALSVQTDPTKKLKVTCLHLDIFTLRPGWFPDTVYIGTDKGLYWTNEYGCFGFLTQPWSYEKLIFGNESPKEEQDTKKLNDGNAEVLSDRINQITTVADLKDRSKKAILIAGNKGVFRVEQVSRFIKKIKDTPQSTVLTDGVGQNGPNDWVLIGFKTGSFLFRRAALLIDRDFETDTEKADYGVRTYAGAGNKVFHRSTHEVETEFECSSAVQIPGQQVVFGAAEGGGGRYITPNQMTNGTGPNCPIMTKRLCNSGYLAMISTGSPKMEFYWFQRIQARLLILFQLWKVTSTGSSKPYRNAIIRPCCRNIKKATAQNFARI